MINGTLKLEKYIVLGREHIVHNLDGDDQRKLITEMYVRKPNVQRHDGGWKEWERFMYNEIATPTMRANGAKCRGRDVSLEEGASYLSVDGTAQDFIDLNFMSDPALETNNIRFIKTYPNQDFLTRKRETSFHKELDIAVDENGNTYIRDDEDDEDDAGMTPTSDIKADFSTIPSGTKFVYHRTTIKSGEEVILVSEVNNWLKNNCLSGHLESEGVTAALESVAGMSDWEEPREGMIYPIDDDLDAMEKCLQADPDWQVDQTFSDWCEDVFV